MSVTLKNLLPNGGKGYPPIFNRNGFTTTNTANYPLPGDSEVSNCLWYVPSASNYECTFQVKSRASLNSEHIYYFSFQVYYPSNNVNGSFDLYWPIAEPSCLSGLKATKGKTWTRLSGVFNRTAFSSQNGTTDIRFDYNNQNSAVGVNLTSFMLIDLTDAFGSGNEPTKEWCDENIPWFDDKITLSISKYKELKPLFLAIANSIRAVSGTNEKIPAESFPEKILNINSKNLNDLSWEEINNLSSDIFKNMIGQTKTVSVSGYGSHNFQLVGVNQDVLSNGEVAKLSFLCKDIVSRRNMNSSATNSGGWANSSMRTFCNNTFYNNFPSDLRSYIKEVKKKYTTDFNYSSPIYTSNDKVWIPSEMEIFGPIESVLDGSWYTYFQDNNNNESPIKKYNNSAYVYWLRSAANASGKFRIVRSDGSEGFVDNANVSYGFVPGFCI